MPERLPLYRSSSFPRLQNGTMFCNAATAEDYMDPVASSYTRCPGSHPGVGCLGCCLATSSLAPGCPCCLSARSGAEVVTCM
ncbi:hypothetical protein GDO81_017914 [Engystomops pustulosus]|uniref:Uncharacterized protein n=1 Tax=Engystomops pustulosus TaxID=76066 RepID=A0AAV7A5V7_ENGPU|nr:hypothetical protein GDO81_017914 [Engystomops pustulosus]